MDHFERPQMKIVATLLAFVLAATWCLEATSAEGRTRYRKAKTQHQRVYMHRSYYPRDTAFAQSSTVGPNGLCQRDTGKPDSELNFRNRCDTEEFWARIQSRGSRR